MNEDIFTQFQFTDSQLKNLNTNLIFQIAENLEESIAELKEFFFQQKVHIFQINKNLPDCFIQILKVKKFHDKTHEIQKSNLMVYLNQDTIQIDTLKLGFEQAFKIFFNEFEKKEKKPVFLFQGIKDVVRSLELDINNDDITNEYFDDYLILKSLDINFSFLHFDFSYQVYEYLINFCINWSRRKVRYSNQYQDDFQKLEIQRNFLTKEYGLNNIQNSFVSILRIVPGISEKKAINVALEYKNLANFFNELKDLDEQSCIEKIANIKIKTNKRQKKGKIGLKVAEKIYTTIFSKNPKDFM